MVLTWALLLAVAQPQPSAASQPEAAVEKKAGDRRERARRIRIGMTADEVQGLLGLPTRTSRQILYQRYCKQWYYQDPYPLWIDFDCGRQREARVQTVHWSSTTHP
jgi:hypothetical protein